jgi:hypothetical protein
MEIDRDQPTRTTRLGLEDPGVVLRATRHGSLVLETANARRRGPRPQLAPVAERQESDQLPEEGPEEQVVEDEPGGGAREEAEDTPGVPGEEERGTGEET